MLLLVLPCHHAVACKLRPVMLGQKQYVWLSRRKCPGVTGSMLGLAQFIALANTDEDCDRLRLCRAEFDELDAT
jgi:hypothetical protein